MLTEPYAAAGSRSTCNKGHHENTLNLSQNSANLVGEPPSRNVSLVLNWTSQIGR